MLQELSAEARRFCAACQPELLALLKTVAAIPAPSHHEERRAAFVKDWLEAAGAQGVYVDEALNVVFPMGCEGRGDIRVFMAHTDVVFPDTEPLPVVERDGRLCAPGVGDDTANLCALLMCVSFLLKNGYEPQEPVLFCFNSCEEGLGNLKGVRQLMADYAGRVREVVTFDGRINAIVNHAVGSTRWRIAVRTEGGHSFGAFGNRNAIRYLASMIDALYAIKVPQEGSRTTYNVGTITGGTSVNTIAQAAEMTFEVRSDRKDCLERMERAVLAVIEAYRAMEIEVETEVLGSRPCMGGVDPQALEALVARCEEAVVREVGEKPRRGSGSTDANIPFSLGIPAVCFGLYRGEGAHTREEWIEIASLEPGMRIGLSLIEPLFRRPS